MTQPPTPENALNDDELNKQKKRFEDLESAWKWFSKGTTRTNDEIWLERCAWLGPEPEVVVDEGKPKLTGAEARKAAKEAAARGEAIEQESKGPPKKKWPAHDPLLPLLNITFEEACRVFSILDYNELGSITKDKFDILTLYMIEEHKEETDEQFARRRATEKGVGLGSVTSPQQIKEMKEAKKRAYHEELLVTLDAFRRLLVTRFGNMVRAWCFLDRGRTGKLSYTQFAHGCVEMNLKPASGSPGGGNKGLFQDHRGLFRCIDTDHSGLLSFREFAPETFAIFEEWFRFLKKVGGDDPRIKSGFEKVFGIDTRNIGKMAFREGCNMIHYTADAKLSSPEELFDLLDADNGGTLDYKTEIEWLVKMEEEAKKPSTP